MGGKKRRGRKQWALRGSAGPEPQLDPDSGAWGQPVSRVPEKLRELAVRTETSMLSACHMPHMTREQNAMLLPSVFHPHAASISGGQRVLLRLLGCLVGAIGFFSLGHVEDEAPRSSDLQLGIPNVLLSFFSFPHSSHPLKRTPQNELLGT